MSSPSPLGQSVIDRVQFQRLKVLAFLPDLSKIRLWAPRGALAITDQVMISGSNFLLGVILARNGGPESYGAYMLMYTSFMLVANIYQAILIEPVNVLAPTLFPQSVNRYVRTVLRMHVIFALFIMLSGGLSLLAAARLRVRPELVNAFAGVMISTPCVLLFWLSRCFAYLELAPMRAVRGSAVYCGTLLTGLGISWLLHPLTPLIAYLCSAMGAISASLFLLHRYNLVGPASGEEPTIGNVWQRHWKFGRWGLGSVGLNWVQGNSVSLIVGPVLGIAQVGILNALGGLMLPMWQIVQAVGRVTLPRIAQIYHQHGGLAIKRPVLRIGAVLVLLTTAYWLVLCLFQRPLMHLLYGDRFIAYAGMLPIISLNLIAVAVSMTCDIAFNGMQSPRSSFGMKIIMVAVMLPVTIFVTWRFGLPGVVICLPSLAMSTAALMSFRLLRHWRNTPDARFS